MCCYIRVKGHLDAGWAAWFESLTITNAEDGEAVLAGELRDQAALHGVLIKVCDLGLPLLLVQQRAAPEGMGARRAGLSP